MPKLEVTQTVTTSLKMSPKVLTQVKALCAEYDNLSGTIDAAETRQDELKMEIITAFMDEGEGAALVDGVEVDQRPLKVVITETSRLDEMMLKRGEGLSDADLAKYKVTKQSKPYLRIGKRGKSKP